MQDTRPLLCLDMDRVLVNHLPGGQVVHQRPVHVEAEQPSMLRHRQAAPRSLST